jgi:hypothetical protein
MESNVELVLKGSCKSRNQTGFSNLFIKSFSPPCAFCGTSKKF